MSARDITTGWNTRKKGETDLTEWLPWFLECLGRPIDGAETLLASIFTNAGSVKASAHRP